MAISEDRLKVCEITKSTVSNFNSMSDSPFEGINFGDGLISGYGNSIIDTINGYTGTINSYMTGFESKINGCIADVNDFCAKNLSFNTKSLGFFENFLCGNFPSLGIRLPDFLGSLKDINLGFNLTICGKSKFYNPLDAALAIVDLIKDPSSLFSGIDFDWLDDILGSSLSSQLRALGISGLPDCLMDDARWSSRSMGSPFGMTLTDRMWFYNLLDGDNCGGDFLRGSAYSSGVGAMTASSILGMLSGYGGAYTYDVANKLYNNDSYATSLSVSKLFNNDNGDNIYNKLDVVSSIYTTQSYDDFNSILSYDTYYAENNNNQDLLDSLLGGSNLGIQDRVTTLDRVGLAMDSQAIFDSLNNDNKNSSTSTLENFRNMVMVANTVDPNWNRDEEGNISLHKTRSNPAVKDMSDTYLQSQVPYSILSGTESTKLGLAAQMSVINAFPQDPVMQI